MARSKLAGAAAFARDMLRLLLETRTFKRIYVDRRPRYHKHGRAAPAVRTGHLAQSRVFAVGSALVVRPAVSRADRGRFFFLKPFTSPCARCRTGSRPQRLDSRASADVTYLHPDRQVRRGVGFFLLNVADFKGVQAG